MKKITMKNFVIGCAAISLLLTACGDDVTNDSVVKAEAYESKADLPDCGEKYEGMFATVPSKKEVYLCSEGSWKSLLNSTTASAVKDGEFACSTVELKDKSGYKVVCGGDSVAVVKNGANGSNGSQGPAGPSGAPGESGSDGSGSNGKDLTLGKDDCAVMYTGLETVVYDCGDSAYVKNLSGFKSKYVWNAMYSVVSAGVSVLAGTQITSFFYDASGSGADKATYQRWKDDDVAFGTTLMASKEHYANKSIHADVTLTVAEARKVTAKDYRSFVGFHATLSATDMTTKYKGGFCLTYTADNAMALLLKNANGYIKAEIPASKGKESIVDILFNDFKPVAEGVTVDDVIKSVTEMAIEAVGSEKAGKYANSFSIYQIGNYGSCDNFTYSTWKDYLKTVVGKPGKLVDNRDKDNPITYATATIGDQTWMAENLRYGTQSCFYSSDKDCATYGRKYTWLESLGDDATKYGCAADAACTTTLPDQVQGICPDGWHLPSTAEWGKLIETVAGENLQYKTYSSIADGLALAMGPTSSTDPLNYQGENLTGLGLTFPATGYQYYWSNGSAAASTGNAIRITWGGIYVQVFCSNYSYATTMTKTSSFPVRCIKDQAKE